MRNIRFLALCVLLSLGGAEARTLVDTGPVTIKADLNSNEGCTVGLDGELCALTWNTNDTSQPGDDAISFNKTVDEASIQIRETPEGSPYNISLQPENVAIDNPAFGPANETWKEANTSLPGALRNYVSLDSDEQPPYEIAAATWGLSINARPPPGTPFDAISPDDSLRVWVLCWDLYCGFMTWTMLKSDEKQLHVASEGYGGRSPWDSDDWLEQDFAGQEGVFACRRVTEELECPGWAFTPAREIVAEQVNASEEFTPRVGWFQDANRVSVQLEPVRQTRSTGEREQSALPLRAREGAIFQWASHERHAPPTSVPAPAERPSSSGSDRIVAVQGLPVTASSIRLQTPMTESSSRALVTLAGGIMLGLLLGVILYSRLRRERALEQETRRRICEAIRESPGVRIGTLASRLGLDHKTVSYHARRLEEFGLVKAVGGANNLYVPAGGLSPVEEERCIGVLARASTKSVYEHLAARGPCDLPSLARGVGLGYSTVGNAVSRLLDAGLVVRRRAGRRWVVSAVPARR
ncbi:MAG TPA: helix-turn-helix domain-containing protein [Gemmatimonadaceae bacterium]